MGSKSPWQSQAPAFAKRVSRHIPQPVDNVGSVYIKILLICREGERVPRALRPRPRSASEKLSRVGKRESIARRS
jgi:hypothetical protein